MATAPEVYAAWARNPRANVGIVTGPDSGIWVLDIDPAHDGNLSLAALEMEHGALPKTYTARTGSGGLHFYFDLAGVDFDLNNATGAKGANPKFPRGMDVRGRGGFVVAPPSVSGFGSYGVLPDPDAMYQVSPVVSAPAWCIERQRPRPYVRPEILPDAVFREGHSYALSAVQGELSMMATAMPGTRNDVAFKVGCRLYELTLAEWAGLDFDMIEAAFLDACERANVDGKFLYGEAWSVWLKAQRKVKEPAILPPATFHGTPMPGWAVPPGAPPSDFDQAGESPANPFTSPGQPQVSINVAAPLINGPTDLELYAWEREVGQAERRIQVNEEAARRVDERKFLRSWREPISHPDLAVELALPEEDMAWRIAGLLPTDGNAVVVAPRKTGKTTLVGDLVRSLVDGQPFLGNAVTALSGGVALFNYENTARQQRAWLRSLGIEHPERVHTLHLRGNALSLAIPRVRAWVVAWLKSHEVEVCIPDPYLRAAQGVVLNENDNGQANVFTGLLDEIKAEAGVREIVMPSHASNKGEVESGSETMRGAGRIEDWADALWYLTSVDGQRFIRATGRDVELAETQLHFDDRTRRLGISRPGHGRREVALEGDVAVVSKVLREWVGASPPGQREVETACDWPHGHRVGNAVRWLVERDLCWIEFGPNRTKYHHWGPKPKLPNPN